MLSKRAEPGAARLQPPRIAVIGPGALGCLYAWRLGKGGRSVALLDKDAARARRLRDAGVGPADPADGAPLRLPVLGPGDAAEAFDLALVLVKARDTRAAAETLAARLAPDGVAVSLQNGLGNLEVLVEVLGARRAGAGVTTQGASLAGEGRFRQVGTGLSRMAPAAPEARPGVERLAEELSACGLPARVEDRPAPILWWKAAASAGMNPCCALSGLDNLGVAESPVWSRLAALACREAAAVARAAGVKEVPEDPWPEVREVLRTTGANRNSMQADVAAGRPTEIEAIHGELIKHAERLGVETPVVRALYRLIKVLEDKKK